MRAETLILRT